MMSKGSEKIGQENILGKKGGLGTWQDISDMPPEYWSDDARKIKTVEEMYEGKTDEEIRKIAIAAMTPIKSGESAKEYSERIVRAEQEMIARNPGESDDKYSKRMKKLQKELGKTANLPPLKEIDNRGHVSYGEVDENGQPIINDENGHSLVRTTKKIGDERRKVVHRFRFEEHQPQQPEDFPGLSKKGEEEYEKELTSTLETFTSEAVSDMDAAKDPENPKHILNISELKKERKLNRGNVEDEVVNYYIGPDGIFSGYGDDDYTDDERIFVADRRAEYEEKDRQNSDITAIQKEGRKFEGLFFPMVKSGAFGEDAAYVIASERDDDGCKTDAAIVIQTETLGPQPICFDLTVSKLSDRNEDNNKLASIKKGFDKYHGIVHPNHLYTCLGDELPYLEQGIPHFVLCLPWNRSGGTPEFPSLKSALVEGKSIPQEVQALIDMQVFLQAAYWGRHYSGFDQENSQKQSKLFNGLAVHFRDRFCASMGLEANKITPAVNSTLNRHPDATRFISKFMLQKRQT
ncbi:MAG: hypothetical protein Q4F56_01235 [Candidatus Saccharibacteria bacterium]|nr:hypothetical protein [Candidatus Saccharibacteria bacterium]